jgi:hypothetical protein
MEVVRAQGGQLGEEPVDLGLRGKESVQGLFLCRSGLVGHRPILRAGELPCDQLRSTAGTYQLDRSLLLHSFFTASATSRYDVRAPRCT